MVDKIVKFKNGYEYLMLDETVLENKKYYLGIKIEENNEPTSTYLFFEEVKKDDITILNPIWDEEMKGLLLTAFTVNFLDLKYEADGGVENE